MIEQIAGDDMTTHTAGAQTAAAPAVPAWRRALRLAVRDPDELVDLLGLPESFRAGARRAAALFPLVVPREYIARMRPGDPADPLLRQVLPLGVEVDPPPHADATSADPVGDLDALAAPGLILKYHGRALLITSGSCAVNCRFCFRRQFPYDRMPRTWASWQPALEAIAADASLTEVILSGGDPLVLDDPALRRLAEALAGIPHLRRLRVHSRLPVVLPSRVDESLLDWMRGTRLTPIMVIHANHPAELTGECPGAIARLVDAGIPVLNQAVLLRGVNDDTATMEELCLRLSDLRVIPYYLHQLDAVAGADHFHVADSRGRAIMSELRRRLPGWSLPRYVREVPGAASKIELFDRAP